MILKYHMHSFLDVNKCSHFFSLKKCQKYYTLYFAVLFYKQKHIIKRNLHFIFNFVLLNVKLICISFLTFRQEELINILKKFRWKFR